MIFLPVAVIVIVKGQFEGLRSITLLMSHLQVTSYFLLSPVKKKKGMWRQTFDFLKHFLKLALKMRSPKRTNCHRDDHFSVFC